ncbi:MAG: acyl-CoA dehydrogenase family protein [Thermomicrobiales bacterium]
MTATATLNGRALTTGAPAAPFPKTARQAEFMKLADGLAEVAAAQADAHDRANTFPHDTFAALRESGYLALTVPEEFGGRGATPLELMLAQERLARGNGSVALGATMHLGIVAGLGTSRAWPAPLLARFFREVVEEGALINSAASEPELGSPSRGGMYATRAVRAPGGWRINGRKCWTTLAPALRYTIVLLTVEEEDGSTSRGHFLVPTSTPGVRIEETWDNLSMRATGSHDVVYEDVVVPDDYRLPSDQSVPVSKVSPWGLLSSAVYLGIATAARDFAVQYARERRPSGLNGPIAELQSVQHRIARIELLLLQARSVLYGTIETFQDHPEHREAIGWQFAAAKYTVTNNAIQITDQALRVVGSAGLARRYPLERYFRDVRAGLGNPPMDDMALTLIGKTALGIS